MESKEGVGGGTVVVEVNARDVVGIDKLELELFVLGSLARSSVTAGVVPSRAFVFALAGTCRKTSVDWLQVQ